MTSTKEATLTIVREVSKKQLTRADGKAFVVHNLVAKSEDKGREFNCSMFLDVGEEPPIGEARPYQVTAGKREGEWVIKQTKRKVGPVYQSRMSQEIHAAAMIVAKDLLLAGRIKTVDEMIRLSQELATVMVSDWRKY